MADERPKVVAATALFVVSDLQRSLDFYVQKLGYEEPGTWGEPPCFAMAHRDGFDLMLSLAESPAQVCPSGPRGVWDLYLKVADIAAEQRALAAAGVPLAKQPHDTPYNIREIEIVDPDGYRICLGQELGDS